jgi:hypothetical protein
MRDTDHGQLVTFEPPGTAGKERSPTLKARLAVTTSKQTAAARKNIKKAQAAASREKTLAHLPRSTREDLGRQGAKGRGRHGNAGHALEDRNRSQLYELAKERNIAGRSRMGKWDLIDALRK